MSAVPTRLLVGLGNPGPEYDDTRHNVGFALLERLAERLGRPWLQRGRALVARVERRGVPCLLVRPTTYMNRSGRAVRDLLADLEGPVELLVVCDDFNLPLGRLRCRRKGSAGGQKGLASIIAQLPGQEVPRLRLGIGEPGRVPAEEFVLRPFKRGEAEVVERMLDDAATLLLDWLEDGDLDRLMNLANAPA